MNRIESNLKLLTGSKAFNAFIFSLILLSAIITGIETYPSLPDKLRELLVLIDRIIIFCFAIEIILKIGSNGRQPWRFFADPWNVFDFIIVAVCLIPFGDTHYFAVLRIFRVFRILRMITFFPKLRLIISALLKSIPSMGYVILLIAILFYVYAIIGVFVFGETDPMHFGDLHHTIVTLFKVLTLEGWTDIMNVHIFGSNGNTSQEMISFWPFVYFASFILIGAMIILNLFIGIIMNSMEESQRELAQEMEAFKLRGASTEELYRHIISKLDDLNNEIKTLKKG